MRARGCCGPWLWAGVCVLASLWQPPLVAGYALNAYTTHEYLVGIKYDHSIPLEARSERYRHQDNYEPFALTQTLSAKKKYVMAYLEVSATVQEGGQVAFCVVQGGAGSTTVVFTLQANATDFLSYSYRAYGISEVEYRRLAAVSATVGATLCSLRHATDGDVLAHGYNATDSLALAYNATDTPHSVSSAINLLSHDSSAKDALHRDSRAIDSLPQGSSDVDLFLHDPNDFNTSRLELDTKHQAQTYISAKDTTFEPSDVTNIHSPIKSVDATENLTFFSNELESSTDALNYSRNGHNLPQLTVNKTKVYHT